MSLAGEEPKRPPSSLGSPGEGGGFPRTIPPARACPSASCLTFSTRTPSVGVRGQEPGSSAAAPLDFESLIGGLSCPGLGEAEAAALDMLEFDDGEWVERDVGLY